MRARTKVWYICMGAWLTMAVVLAGMGSAKSLLALGLAYFYWHAAELNAKTDETLLRNGIGGEENDQ